MRGKRKRHYILLAIVCILVVISFPYLKPKDINVKKELVSKALETAVAFGNIPDYTLIKDKKNIIVSSENIDSKLLPELSSVKFIVLSPTEIKEKANKEGGFLYITFRRIDINRFHANLSINNVWAVQDNSKKDYLSGGGMTIKFYNLFGKWLQKRSTERWIS